MQQNQLGSVAENFLALIKAIRIEQNLTLEQLAERAGIHRTMVGRLERRERVPTIQVANQIAHALGFSLSDLVQMAESISSEENSKFSLSFLKPRRVLDWQPARGCQFFHDVLKTKQLSYLTNT